MTEHEGTGAPDDVIFTALYLGAEQTRLPDEPAFDVELGLQRFSSWLDGGTRTSAAAGPRRTLPEARHRPNIPERTSRPGSAMRRMAVYLGLIEDESQHDDDYPDEYDEDGSAPGEQDGSSVQPVDLASITTLYPRTYNDARTIGEHFREGTPVIINLTELTGSDARRLVDFAAGLIFGLRGSIDKVTNRVFLLTPANVEVRPAAENTAEVRPAEEGPTTSIQARKDRAL